jgi:threonine/homoserine/homoserine lactone efflux protein
MDLGTWVTIGSVCLAGAMSPGPSLAVVVKNTIVGGRSRGMATGLGHGIGVGIYAFGAVVGVAALVDSWPNAVRGIELLGGFYLIWLGIGALRHAGAGADDNHDSAGRSGFLEGFAVAFLNPKIAVFFLALLGSLLPSDATTLDRAGVAGLAMFIDAFWYMFAALALATTGAADWLRDRGLWVDRVLGVLLIAVGLYLFV